MSSGFCLLEEAFTAAPIPGTKKEKDKDRKKNDRFRSSREGFVPGALAGSPDPDAVPSAMQAPTGVGGSKPEATVGHQDFFPLPGESAAPEEWARAFMLDPSQGPGPRPDGSIPVGGKSTLWRPASASASASPSASPSPSPITVRDSDIHQRLDALARQLDALTLGSPLQSTAELFLFIAIGLLLLLAIDTLLRYATTIAVAKKMRGKMHGGYRDLNSRWRSHR